MFVFHVRKILFLKEQLDSVGKEDSDAQGIKCRMCYHILFYGNSLHFMISNTPTTPAGL